MDGVYNSIMLCNMKDNYGDVLKDIPLLVKSSDIETCSSEYNIDLTCMYYNTGYEVESSVLYSEVKTIDELLEKLEELNIKIDENRIVAKYKGTKAEHKTILVGPEETEELCNGTFMIGLNYLD